MKSQRGGFFLGMIVGMLVGLALALGVALYIAKVPLPFIDKVPQRTAEQDAAEAEKNKNWDPNNPLYGKNPAKPRPVQVEAAPSSANAVGASAVESPVAGSAPAPKASAPAASATSGRNPAAILAGEAVSSPAGADALSYQVQAGAYGSQTEAEQQRAKLGLMGLEAHLQEREVNGRTMYRVRLGPFGQREQAEDVRVKLQAAGIESALVRVQK
ncbi:MAG: SPOR domain-containing protein [Aquabacterium commune]|uniref:SPOR domain-containing protein n=1 Tax=Aquabacterium commune TaxID=70586 RepID=UPI003BAFF1C9